MQGRKRIRPNAAPRNISGDGDGKVVGVDTKRNPKEKMDKVE